MVKEVIKCALVAASVLSFISLWLVSFTKLLQQNPNRDERDHNLFDEQEKEQIKIGLRIMANPESPSKSCSKTNYSMKRLLVREHLGIDNVSAEHFFEQKILPFMHQKHLLVDVGANTGQFAVPMASLGHSVISFEPSPATCDIFLNNVKKANVSNIELHCSLVSSTISNTFFHQDPKGLSASNKQISLKEAEILRESGRGEEILMSQSVTVDSVVGSRKAFLLKTDTQGYERAVLEGAIHLLQNDSLRYLLIEFSYYLLNLAGTKPIELLNFIYGKGYMCTYLGFHTVTKISDGKKTYSLVDAPSLFDDNKLSISFEEFVDSLKVVSGPDAPYGQPGWSDLFCWKRC